MKKASLQQRKAFMNSCDVVQLPFHQKSRRSLGREVTRTERFRQEQVQRFDFLYRIKAANHSTGRNEAVAELLCYLSLLRNAGTIRQQAVVQWDKAHVQSISASQSGQVGAHALPCQILIDGQRPSDLLLADVLDRESIRHRLRMLFGKVTVLPKIFNITDSRAEDNCLRGALVEACETVIRETQPVQRSAGVLRRGVGLNYGEIELTRGDRPEAAGVGIDHAAVQSAYQVWCERARETFDRTIAVVEARGATMAGQDVSGEVIYILGQYRDSLTRLPAILNDQRMYRLEEHLWV
ncbi:MAG: hypothetical protein D6736_04290 [Nitrospinota bacterium]|nr:MAG: hypothetical protein D6736_04290 [Nitrospinota bacterium]